MAEGQGCMGPNKPLPTKDLDWCRGEHRARGAQSSTQEGRDVPPAPASGAPHCRPLGRWAGRASTCLLWLGTPGTSLPPYGSWPYLQFAGVGWVQQKPSKGL